MADQDFALPLGHLTTGVSNISLCMGRPFRQPIDIPAENTNFSSGLEVWLSDTDPDRSLFAMYNGEIQYAAATANQPNKITLTVSVASQTRFNRMIEYRTGNNVFYSGLIEPIPFKVIYNNVDYDLTRNYLIGFITDKYNLATQNPTVTTWHRIMTVMWNDLRFKEFLDAANTSGNLNTEIVNFIDDFFLNGNRLPFYCGDIIAIAGMPATGNNPPSTCTLVNPRYIVINILEYAGNFLSPKYYIWRFLKNANNTNTNLRYVSFITSATLRGDNTFDHPLLDALNIDLDTTILPREIINITLPGQTNPQDALLFPIQEMGNWHGIQLTNRAPNPDVQVYSSIEWRITNDDNLDFEVRRRNNENNLQVRLCGENVGVDVCPTPIVSGNPNLDQATLLRNVWNTWGNAINEICTLLQFPSEIIAASIRQESNNNQRALALEPLQSFEQEQTILNHNQIVPAYPILPPLTAQIILNKYNALCPLDLDDDGNTQYRRNGYPIRQGLYGLNVPNPWQGDALINANRGDMTWDELLYVVDVLPSRMSPGIIQTLVSNASGRIEWLRSWFPNYDTDFSVQPFPTVNRDIFLWLLEGRQSILFGTGF